MEELSIAQHHNTLLQLLDIGITRILHDAQTILERDDCFHCVLPGAYFWAAHAPESGPIPLGILLRLWERSMWMSKCPRCRDWVFVTGATGDLVSGEHQWWGHCASCKGRLHQEHSTPASRWAAFDFLETLYNPLRIYQRRYYPGAPLYSHGSSICMSSDQQRIRTVQHIPSFTFIDLLHTLNVEERQSSNTARNGGSSELLTKN